VSRKTHTILTIQIKVPVPAGRTQEQTLNLVKGALTTNFLSQAAQIQVKIVARETHYL